jgi:hypothetical protein
MILPFCIEITPLWTKGDAALSVRLEPGVYRVKGTRLLPSGRADVIEGPANQAEQLADAEKRRLQICCP